MSNENFNTAKWRATLLKKLRKGAGLAEFCADVRSAVAQKLYENGFHEFKKQSPAALEDALHFAHTAIGRKWPQTHANKATEVYLALRDLEGEPTHGRVAIVTLLVTDLLSSPTRGGKSDKYSDAREIFLEEVAKREKAGTDPTLPTLREWQTLIQTRYPDRYKTKSMSGLEVSTDVTPMLSLWRARILVEKPDLKEG